MKCSKLHVFCAALSVAIAMTCSPASASDKVLQPIFEQRLLDFAKRREELARSRNELAVLKAFEVNGALNNAAKELRKRIPVEGWTCVLDEVRANSAAYDLRLKNFFIAICHHEFEDQNASDEELNKIVVQYLLLYRRNKLTERWLSSAKIRNELKFSGILGGPRFRSVEAFYSSSLSPTFVVRASENMMPH